MYIFHSTNVSCIPALVISILVAMGPGLLSDWFVDNRFSVFISAIAATMNVTSSTLQNINPEFNRTIWFSLMCGKYALTDAFIVRTFRLIFLYKHTLIFTLINLLICDDQLLYMVREPLHDDVINWKHFSCYWPFVRGIHRSQRASTAELWCFLWSAPK